MLVPLLRNLLRLWNELLSFFRLLKPRLFGLRTGAGVCVGSGIEWPLGNVRNLQLGDRVSLGRRGWFYLPLSHRQARIKIGAGNSNRAGLFDFLPRFHLGPRPCDWLEHQAHSEWFNPGQADPD